MSKAGLTILEKGEDRDECLEPLTPPSPHSGGARETESLANFVRAQNLLTKAPDDRALFAGHVSREDLKCGSNPVNNPNALWI
jgi:hypothetical protein